MVRHLDTADALGLAWDIKRVKIGLIWKRSGRCAERGGQLILSPLAEGAAAGD